MPDAAATKVCPQCAETIKAQAKLCPHCQTRQGRWVVLKGELLGWGAVLLLLFGVPALIGLWFEGTSDGNSLAFVVHRNDLTAKNLEWEAYGAKGDYWLKGLIVNHGRLPWRVYELEVRVQDGQKRLVDVCHVELDKFNRFIVLPGQEHAFRISFNSRTLDAHSTLAVRVQRATDGRKGYIPD